MSSPLGPDALALLPDPDVAMRCSDHSRHLAVDPAGTAVRADVVVVVEVPLPWPKPVFDHQLLAGLGSTMTFAAGPARVLAEVPRHDDGTAVTVYTRRGTTATSWVHRVDDADGLAELFERLAETTDPGSVPGAAAGPGSSVSVCVQGSHDVCCGSDGPRLAAALEAARPDLVVHRVSHTGGHRFAPTALTMPDGRMWAYADAAGLLDVIDRTAPTSTIADRCRGWWGAEPGVAQAAERAVWAELGWDAMAAGADGPTVTVSGDVATVTVADLVFDVTVETAREIPTIACRADGGLPAKPGRELRVTSVEPHSGAASTVTPRG